MDANLPFVTIILPVRNEGRFISSVLQSVLDQDYPPACMEILVADGNSKDGTRELVAEFASKDARIKLIDNAGGIVPTGLNAALKLARGKYIIRVDGHTIIAPDYVRQCVSLLISSSADNAGGKMNAVGSGKFAQAVTVATSSSFGVGGARFHYSDQEEWVDTVYMGAWPLRVFQKIGLFDEEMVRDQDDEFNYRLLENGGRILLSPKIKSSYTVRSSPHSLWTQYFQYGFWKVRVLQKHPRQMRSRQFIPPAFVLSLLISILLSILFPWGWLTLALVAGCYLLANLAASGSSASSKGWRHLPLLPLIYTILHLSYGFGFLIGLVNFFNRWGDKKGKVPKFTTHA